MDFSGREDIFVLLRYLKCFFLETDSVPRLSVVQKKAAWFQKNEEIFHARF